MSSAVQKIVLGVTESVFSYSAYRTVAHVLNVAKKQDLLADDDGLVVGALLGVDVGHPVTPDPVAHPELAEVLHVFALVSAKQKQSKWFVCLFS